MGGFGGDNVVVQEVSHRSMIVKTYNAGSTLNASDEAVAVGAGLVTERFGEERGEAGRVRCLMGELPSADVSRTPPRTYPSSKFCTMTAFLPA